MWSNFYFLSLQISPSSIPLWTFFIPLSWSYLFFMYSFCLPFLDATIRNVYFDGRVLEELICPRIGALCCTPHSDDISTGRKAWDQVENIGARVEDSYLKLTKPTPTDHSMTTFHSPLFVFDILTILYQVP